MRRCDFRLRHRPGGQLVRALHSPFNDAEVVGSLKVLPASATIAREAANYSRLIALVNELEPTLPR